MNMRNSGKKKKKTIFLSFLTLTLYIYHLDLQKYKFMPQKFTKQIDIEHDFLTH